MASSKLQQTVLDAIVASFPGYFLMLIPEPGNAVKGLSANDSLAPCRIWLGRDRRFVPPLPVNEQVTPHCTPSSTKAFYSGIRVVLHQALQDSQKVLAKGYNTLIQQLLHGMSPELRLGHMSCDIYRRQLHGSQPYCHTLRNGSSGYLVASTPISVPI
ncbi:hypothetical protein BDW74DRAFT_3093 [Aspergillus multicolor]|uniref:uncharacterized protein n=1 Tax=Aspergillus multicolor TaxID=41759 RepID=UPI003CCCAA25